MTAVDWLIGELIHKGLMALRYDKDNTFNELIGEAKQMEKQQTEISDEEIEKSISYDSKDPYVEGYINGAKWYREQLKSK